MLILFRNAAIDGAKEGLNLLARNEIDYDRKKEFKSTEYWSDSTDFVFSSFFAASGILMVYGSYNKRDKPVIRDTFIIMGSNMLFSFISALALYMLVGYLKVNGSILATYNYLKGSNQFIFAVIPAGLLGLEGTNFWSIVTYLIFVTVGVDTAAGVLESVTCAIADVPFMRKIPRWVIS